MTNLRWKISLLRKRSNYRNLLANFFSLHLKLILMAFLEKRL